VKDSLDQDLEQPLDYLHQRLPEALAETLIEKGIEDPYPDWRIQPKAPELEFLINMFIRLRRIRVDESLDQLVFLQTQDNQEASELFIDFNKFAQEYANMRSKLDQALRASFNSGKNPLD
jgi:hypothetical protein